MKLPSEEIVFTRYLYIKDEVKLSLMLNILQKNNDAIFWAYELYYSGFKHELFELIWKIYYDFFATNNPTFEAYLLKKHLEFINAVIPQDKVISAIIQDLIIRPFNTDIFFLRKVCELFETEYVSHSEKIETIDDLYSNFNIWVKQHDYRSISHFILNEKHVFDLKDIYHTVLDIFEIKNVTRLLKEFDNILKLNQMRNEINENIMIIKPNVMLLSKIMTLFSNNKKGKSFYVCVEPEEIIPYETIEISDKIRHYRILQIACICSIDEQKQLSLFKLMRYNADIKNMYLNNWEYHASFSPIWLDRFNQFGGKIDDIKQEIVFECDDKMEQFYVRYGYEPDEQTISVQDKSIMKIEVVRNWKWFNDIYKSNRLFEIYDEELSEFDVDGIEY